MLVAAGLLAPGFGVTAQAAAPATLKIVLVGDSTVNDAGGWGQGFQRLLAGAVTCTNLAANGRSSKSFLTEGRWTNALAQKGDYYFIQFGHNDEPGKGPDRETDPATTYTQNLARYVDEARAIGAKPVLVTSLTRRNFDKSGNGKLTPNLLPYVAAMKALAVAKQVPLVDLHASSVAYCERIGPAETAKLNPIGKDGKPDTTHLNAAGRLVFAKLVAADLRQVVPELAPYLRMEPAAAKPVLPQDSQSAARSGTDGDISRPAAPALPTIPERLFSITSYGAVGDGVATNTEALQAAIDAASAAGGGRRGGASGSLCVRARYPGQPYQSAGERDLADAAAGPLSRRDDRAGEFYQRGRTPRPRHQRCGHD